MKKIAVLVTLLVLLFSAAAIAQTTTASIKGNVTDPSGAAVVGARITATSPALGIVRNTTTNGSGDYEIPLLPPGSYSVKVEQTGFQAEQADRVEIEVSQNIVQNFSLKVATSTSVVTVEGTAPIIDSTTMTVGSVIDQRVVQEFPLNGRHFVDLTLLVPGSVTPPQNGFLTAPLRGQGSFAVNTAGMREDQVNWMINGINLSDMVQNQVTFQPVISTVGEFKVDNSTYSADYGRNAGPIVTIASRSGTNQYHGELYEYLRNDFFDARNAFNPVTLASGAANPENPFKRNQFGGDIGGPIYKNKTFFFASYEGERQRQGLALESQVFPDVSALSCATLVTRACIAAAGNPISNAILGIIPHANTTLGASPVPNAFTGAASAPVNIDQGTMDINHNFSDSDRLHGYYVFQHDLRQEPGATGGASIPGFGDTREGHRQVATLGETHVFSSDVVNEANIGYNRIHLVFSPNTAITPSSLGLSSTLGPNEQILPLIDIAPFGLTFGTERNFPQGRGDTTAALNDNLSWIKGRHSLKFGAEFRDFRNNNFNGDPGQLVFTSPTDFMNGIVDSTARTIGNVANRINQNSLDFYAMDSYKWKSYFTWELGIRYGWNMTPSEADGRFVNFVPGGQTGSMLVPTTTPYSQQNKDFQPRVGFAWDLFHDGKTVLRSGYAWQYDEPITGVVTGLSSNPPFALPISVAAATSFTATAGIYGNPIPGSISPLFLSPNFQNPYVQSYNLNIQQELTRSSSIMIGYFGNKGTHLEDDINANQTSVLGSVGAGNSALPFEKLSLNSPILPGAVLASSILEHASGSNSNYNALWATMTQKTSHHLQFNLSYTYSHSIDDVSRDEAGTPVTQNSNDIFLARASSDFDARQRFIGNAIYDLPGNPKNRLLGGWEIAPIVTLQSGSPFNIVVSNSSAINGVSNTVTPDASAPLQISGNPLGQWIANPQVLSNPCPTPGKGGPCTLGNLGRNAVVGPSFMNMDFSLAKNTKLTERLNLQIRCDAFDLFNHPNYANPGPQSGTFLNSVFSGNTPTFSTITATRFPTGDFGSSRQLQLAAKLQF